MAGEKYGEHDPRRAGRAVDRVLRRNALALDRRARHVRDPLGVFDRQRHSAHRVVRVRGGRRVRRQAERSDRDALLVARDGARRAERTHREDAARRQGSADCARAAARASSRRPRRSRTSTTRERSGDRAFVGAVVQEADGDALRHLGNAIRSQLRSGVVALAGIDNGSVSLLVSASDDLVKAGVHAGNLVKLAAPLVAGKGGGQAAQAQGGGTDAGGAEAARARDPRRRLRMTLTRAPFVALVLLLTRRCSGATRLAVRSAALRAGRCERRVAEGRRVFVHRLAGRTEQHRAAPPRLSQRDVSARRDRFAVDGMTLRRKIVRFSHREDRYAVGRFAPRAGHLSAALPGHDARRAASGLRLRSHAAEPRRPARGSIG